MSRHEGDAMKPTIIIYKWGPTGPAQWAKALLITITHPNSWKEFVYLLCSLLTEPVELLERRYANAGCRRDCKKVRTLQMPAHLLYFNHPVGGWITDIWLERRIRELKKIPPGKLTTKRYTEIMGYKNMEAYQNVVIDGNGRLYALLSSGHGEFKVRVNVRSQ